ncbi:hypothetical protein MSBR3_2974 [Methanosarcina barkeri 3]|uniref:Uncharacterized protein n=2 Tax=Methanosarcina barkeri TaxID=2208 RepID=A0A0E3SPD3_METBA|nr:hypothetical protein MSBR3_2974 [Methanosarcina barkeri 3]
MINRTVLCLWNGELVGFVVLLADIIEAKAIIDRLEHYKYRKRPGVKIARLAVDSKFERRDNGNVKNEILKEIAYYTTSGEILSI